jgi:hypothetical protein
MDYSKRRCNFIKREGQRVGFVTITKLSEKTYINPNTGISSLMWDYICDCGNIGSIMSMAISRRLKNEKHKFSCGCNSGNYRETLLLNQNGFHTCYRCKEIKPISEFGNNKTSKNGLQRSCRSCKSITDTEYRFNPKYRQEQLERKRIWGNNRKLNNPQKYAEMIEKRRQTRNYSEEYNRVMNDPFLRCKSGIRRLILSSLKVRNISKSKLVKSTEDILGCTLDKFKIHIENQFENGMNWLNHGEWHFDHIVPLNVAETVDEIIKLNHYSNFKPLWSGDNLSKSTKVYLEHNDLCLQLLGRGLNYNQ